LSYEPSICEATTSMIATLRDTGQQAIDISAFSIWY